ncbi:hypothetical protein Salat_2414600 [Sesamum alatum]|uniref:Secreted protein n=1 Tax=Sesamum alatum TaxID=300844 RepID=A0AAE2CFB4_9LAMI|nr:hypothetical protein Salat_2414600 [Sesamum alatum]
MRRAMVFKVACCSGGAWALSLSAGSSSSSVDSSSEVSAYGNCLEEDTFGGIEGLAGANSKELPRRKTMPMRTKHGMSNGSKMQATYDGGKVLRPRWLRDRDTDGAVREKDPSPWFLFLLFIVQKNIVK